VRSAPDTILPEILNAMVIPSDETSGTLLIYVGEELPPKGVGGFFEVPGAGSKIAQVAQEMLFRPGPVRLPGQEAITWHCVSHRSRLDELPEFFVKFLVKESSDSAFLYPVKRSQFESNSEVDYSEAE